MTNDPREKMLEWEAAVEPIILDGTGLPIPPFMPGTRSVTIERNEDFRLGLRAEGVPVTGELKARHEAHAVLPAGSFMDFEDITFEAYDSKYTLSAFLDPLPSKTVLKRRPGESTFVHEGHVISLVRTCAHRPTTGDDGVPSLVPVGPAAWRSDWFINGPDSGLLFMRFTKRRQATTISRERDFGSVKTADLPLGGNGRDHFVVDAGVVRFAVCQVPDGMAPDWCKPVSIEFRAPFPDAETREAVSEIVSFVLGRRLLRIGSTIYDATGWAVEEEVVNPVERGLRGLCSEHDCSPIPQRAASNDVERALATLVPSYLEKRSPLKLRNVMWAYWTACESPAPIDLAMFRGALEALKTAWLSSKKSETGEYYLPPEDYEALTAALIRGVEEGLAKRPKTSSTATSAIANKLRGANRMGTGEQVQTFFEENGLTLGAAERAAMNAGNKPAHGSVTTGGHLKALIGHGRAYRALFERTFLRVLDYQGEYVDRSTPGFPSRPLDEPAGGSPKRGTADTRRSASAPGLDTTKEGSGDGGA